MGFFTNEKCAVCGERCGTFNSLYLDEGVFICANCKDKVEVSGSYFDEDLKHMNIKEIKEKIKDFEENIKENLEENKTRKRKFKITSQVGEYIFFDDENKMFMVPNITGYDDNIYFAYDEIINYEVIENGETRYKGGIGDTIITGALFGMVGIAANELNKDPEKLCNKYQIKITLKNGYMETLYIDLIDSSVSYDSYRYKRACNAAERIINKIGEITGVKEEKLENEVNYSVADEIKKFKELLDMGAITQEEYDKKKKELLK